MICPHCNKPIDNSLVISESQSILAKIKSVKKSKSSAENGKLGGRPKKLKNIPTKKT
jgi:hypothetical protein